MKIIKYYNLMVEDAPSKCKDGKDHDYFTLQKPANFRSGWHRDKCRKCGIEVGYDTSD